MIKWLNVEKRNVESNDAENNNSACLVISLIDGNTSKENDRSNLFKN
jgi:hypothetical protein